MGTFQPRSCQPVFFFRADTWADSLAEKRSLSAWADRKWTNKGEISCQPRVVSGLTPPGADINDMQKVFWHFFIEGGHGKTQPEGQVWG